jgi:hypothetical protein
MSSPTPPTSPLNNPEGDDQQRSDHEQSGFEWMPLLVFCLVILALGVGAVYTAMA